MKQEEEHWTLIIKPNQSIFSFDYKALWRFRDLLFLFVKRDIISVYKQTILGPLWFLIQPLLTTITYILIFSNIAKISTDGLPPVLFYLSGIILWSYYSDCLLKTSETFTANASIFGKVYFPRLIVPVSIIISSLTRLGIQFLLFLCCYFYFYVKGADIHINSAVWLFPILLVLMAGHGLALGIIISSLTTKYRDFKFLVQFGVQLLMYASPVVYPLSSVEQNRWILLLNPMTSIIETFKYGFLGVGVFQISYLIINFLMMVIILAIALLLFNKVEKKFLDTV
ncbi:MAG TPA: ABC transporter permease [Bacteroidia bacterium]|nr:ABC transporter permease [Bacteroidia bacterium]